MSLPEPLKGTPVIALAALFFAFMAVATRTLAGTLPSAQVSAIRFAVGLGGAGLLFVLRRRGPDLKRWRLLALRGLLGGAAVLTYFLSIEELGAAPATVLNYTSPVFASLFAFLFLGERTPRASRIGLALATIGAALVAWASGRASTDVHLVGVAAGLATPILGGAAMATVRKARDDTDALSVFFAFCLVGLLMSAPLAWWGWRPVEAGAGPALVAVGLFGLFGQILFTWGMGHTTATAGSAATQLVPALVWVMAIGWLGERVSTLAVAGALLCVGGVLLGIVPWRRFVGRRRASLP